MVFYEVLQVLLLKYCKLIHYIQYNFSGEKNIHRFHIQDIEKVQTEATLWFSYFENPSFLGVFCFCKDLHKPENTLLVPQAYRSLAIL